MNNQYSPEVLVTLGILIQRIPAKAGELVPIVIETCLTALTSWHDYSSIYDASMCLTFVARAGDIRPSMLPLMEQMVKLIEDQVMPVDTRRAVIDAIASMSGVEGITGTYASYYGTLLTLAEEHMVDIDTADATIIDIRDTNADGQYNKTVTTLAAMQTAVEKKAEGVVIGYEVSLDMYVDDGAVLIVVTDISVGD